MKVFIAVMIGFFALSAWITLVYNLAEMQTKVEIKIACEVFGRVTIDEITFTCKQVKP